MKIDRLDHLVLTVSNVAATCEFYARVLGMGVIEFDNGRRALRFGRQKINLHPADAPIVPHAREPIPGSADLCFISVDSIQEVIADLQRENIFLEEGPVDRTGANGTIVSVYFRDPDGNLIEIAEYPTAIVKRTPRDRIGGRFH